MLKKFALLDDGTIAIIPRPEKAKDADDAGRQLGTDVLFTLDKAELKALQNNIVDVLGNQEKSEAIAHMDSLSLQDAMWWFLENVSEDSPARSDCFFALRRRRVNEAR